MKSGNPVLNERVFSQNPQFVNEGAMTIQGTVNKSFMLLALVVGAAAITWGQVADPQSIVSQFMRPLTVASAIIGFIIAMITTFKKEWAPVTAPMYAIVEGVFLGAVSSLFNKSYPGIAVEAVAITFGVFFCLLAAYQAGVIKASPTFMKVVVAATMGIALYYIVSMVIGIFGIQAPLIHSNSGMGIAFSVVVVIVAALNLVLDFDLIERGAQEGAAKYMEWFSAFALLVTLIWLYLEILRLLSKISSRR